MNRSLRMASLSLAVILGLSGCATTDPYTREQKTSNATVGTGIGVITGAIIGAAVSSKSDRGKGALIGAGIGGLAGGSVGYYMDQQEMKLRQQLEGTGVSVTRVGDQIILNMPGNVTFDTNQDQVKSQFYPTLNSVALVLKEFENTLVTVAGHTDSIGEAAYNQALSDRRARSVAHYLVNQQIPYQRVAAIGYGESRPIADNINKAGRAKNRRVELTLDPIVR
ncbi:MULTISPECIES: OmpA family protein [Ferrimonas]|uniref:OmpA family protein n=1 Tax=Ferrimonas TaxID=44011 RepID=UPI00040D2B3C|nr:MULTISPECIES: OmpA family protein [Ferrimonas]USD36214.1 OmpA family protein [Ferrimonas sp. SCSIO 43195]